MLALSHLRVVELTEALAGPYAAMMLGDLGAEVIKIERPGVGDQSRRWGKRWPHGESAYFCATNRNKRSLSLNVQFHAGQEVLHRLLATADVLICNIPRADSLRKLGLDPESVRARYPRLIYASITGYGRTGPYAEQSGYDLVAQGESGLMSLTGTSDTVPMRYPIPLADMTTGLYTVIGVLAALQVRALTGQGQVLDTSLLEAQAAYLGIIAGDFFATGQPPVPPGNAHPSIVPYQVFTARDQQVIICVGSDKQWRQLCALLGMEPAWRDDPRYASNPGRLHHRAEVVTQVQSAVSQWAAADLLAALRQAEIPCGAINSVPQLLSDPHYTERNNLIDQPHPLGGVVRTLASPVRLSDTPPAYRLPPPTLGQHTEAILTELGYTSAAIEALRADNHI